MRAILLSGGIDSAALACWQKPDLAININYGQKPAIAERRASQSIAKALNIPLQTIDIDCSSIGSGDLTAKAALPEASVSEWWPYRNQLLITLAVSVAISYKVKELIVGAVKTDSKHRDGTAKFYQLIDRLTAYQEGNLRIEVPAIRLSTIELIRRSKIDLPLLGWTHSCHTGDYPCGNCNGCNKHLYIKGRLKLL